jgi:hypothetical protein
MGQVYEQRPEFPRGAMLAKAVSTDVFAICSCLVCRLPTMREDRRDVG